MQYDISMVFAFKIRAIFPVISDQNEIVRYV